MPRAKVAEIIRPHGDQWITGVRAGERAGWRFIEFFMANIRNRNTRAAYAQAAGEFFSWCEKARR